MKQQVLKALANPSHIFYVPYSLAVINFVVQFLAFVVIFVLWLMATKFKSNPDPLWFLLSVIVVHSILAIFSRRDPQIGQIIVAKLQLLRKRIPGRMVA